MFGGACWQQGISSLKALIERWGNGRSILVSTRKWLPHKPVFVGADQPQLLVSDLIDSSTMQWDREKIFDLFAHPTRMEILAIPLPMTTSRDKLLWKENSANMFICEVCISSCFKT